MADRRGESLSHDRAAFKCARNEPLAHVSEDGRVHPLYDHLIGTAKLAGGFAAEFGRWEWGYTAGLWHDLGKYSEGLSFFTELLKNKISYDL